VKSLDLDDIVLSLTGPINATGSHEVDERHLENLKTLTQLIDRLLYVVSDEAPYAKRKEASMNAIGIHAKTFLNDVHNAYGK